MSATETDAQNSWRFAQCFGDKGEVEDITEGESSLPYRSSSSGDNFEGECPFVMVIAT